MDILGLGAFKVWGGLAPWAWRCSGLRSERRGLSIQAVDCQASTLPTRTKAPAKFPNSLNSPRIVAGPYSMSTVSPHRLRASILKETSRHLA